MRGREDERRGPPQVWQQLRRPIRALQVVHQRLPHGAAGAAILRGSQGYLEHDVLHIRSVADRAQQLPQRGMPRD